MKFPSRDGWAKFGFEGVLIVVSILLAFSIESWQAERDLLAEEQRILHQLKSEFEANVELLALRWQNQERILQAAAWPSMIRDIAEDEQVARDFSLGPLTTYLAEHGPLRNIQTAGMRDSPTGPGPGPSRFSSAFRPRAPLVSDWVFVKIIRIISPNPRVAMRVN